MLGGSTTVRLTAGGVFDFEMAICAIGCCWPCTWTDCETSHNRTVEGSGSRWHTSTQSP